VQLLENKIENCRFARVPYYVGYQLARNEPAVKKRVFVDLLPLQKVQKNLQGRVHIY
jgi:hypothetical protein